MPARRERRSPAKRGVVKPRMVPDRLVRGLRQGHLHVYSASSEVGAHLSLHLRRAGVSHHSAQHRSHAAIGDQAAGHVAG